jgi:myosin heavy subunit
MLSSGHTKVFMRTPQAQNLELAREKALLTVTIKIQKIGRGMVYRRKYKRYKQILSNLSSAISQRTEKALKDAIDMSFELPWGGSHVGIVIEAKVTMHSG